MKLALRPSAPLFWPVVGFVAGVVLTLFVAWQVQQHNLRAQAQAMQQVASQISDTMAERLLRYQFGLRGARGAVVTAGENGITRDIFHRYSQTRDLQREFPGAGGFGFVRRVPADQREVFLATARTDDPDFNILQMAPHAGDLYVIQYVEPVGRNRQAIGLDIASEDNRRDAALAALQTGEARLTGPITLVQAAGKPHQSFLFLLPVFRGDGTMPLTQAGREAALFGWSYAPLSMDEVLVNLGLDPHAAQLTVADITQSPQATAFYSTALAPDAGAAVDSIDLQQGFYGRQWRLSLHVYPAFADGLNLLQPVWVILVGVMLSVLKGLLIWTLTQSRQRKSLLRSEQARRAAIVESSIDAIIGKGLDGKVTSWNQGAERLFGYRAAEAIGCNLPERLAEQEAQELQIQRRVVAGEAIPAFETVRRHRDGRMLDVSISLSPVRDADGKIIGISKTVRDISEQKATQEQIRQLNSNLEAQVSVRTEELATALRERNVLLQTINEQLLYSVSDPDGRILEVNQRLCEASGYTREELIGQNHRIFNSGVHPQGFWAGLWHTISHGQAWRGEICNVAKDGSLRWFNTVIAPYADADGVIERYVALRVDVTDRKLSNMEVDRLNNLLGSVLRAASEYSIIATDLDGIITVFNEGAERMLGYRADELVGKVTPELLHVREEVEMRRHKYELELGVPLPGVRTLMAMAGRTDAAENEWTYVRRDGSHIPVSIVVTAIRDEQGEATGYLGIAQDISRRREFEAGLRQAREMAEAASVAKSQFLANMSHEIRTPMNAVLGMLQLLRQTELDTRQLDYTSKAQTAATSLLGLLNDILDFSKIDAGKLQLDIHPFELEELLRDLAVILSGSYGNKNVEVMYQLPPTLPAMVRGDQLRLQQILINLAGNALKFTDHGYVVVGIEALARSAQRINLRFSVRDTGIGIEPDHLQRIFDGFTQAEASTTRRYGGTGLGLAISKKLVDLMGGQLQVTSTRGEGSRFWFDLAFEIADDVPIAVTHGVPDLRVLIVDDLASIGEILVNTVETIGWQADYAASGRDAIQRVDAAREQQRPYDVVLMDWRMPGLDGLQAATAIQHGSAQPPVVIMVTAYGREVLGDVAHRGDAPFVAFLSKPVTPQQLIDAIEQSLAQSAAPAAPEAAVLEPERLGGLNILVVEDNALNRQVAYELLRYEGAEVELAEGGLQGVEMALTRHALYDLVIMDVQMPDIDGLTATRRIRADARGADIPILAMTANVSEADQQACLEAGMNGHVGKPIDMEEVVQKVLALTRAPAADAAAASAPQTAEAALIEPYESLVQRFGGQVEVYRAALNLFPAECQRMQAELERQVAMGDLVAAAATLHALKGMAGTMGAVALAQLAAALEQKARNAAADRQAASLSSADITLIRDLAAHSADLLGMAAGAR
ncbi:CHASE domain-containing hybrid sensor histidine kinase/response regulator [Amantichitinum ursilacus]|uniref:Sensory/regulatory protein RpfC n=1 Tax=Amantichitinum ursilacus TaxID=857265 RepID=A0A0N0XKD1_9NEIS|nr:PAS domain S-box protein [Amantichitinum ursilacus]KPC54609.1 Signal transduction histidine-protein kinase BarA [Amantichitinum ursilacus]